MFLCIYIVNILPQGLKCFSAIMGNVASMLYKCLEAAARLSCLAPEDFEKKIDSIGKPVRGVRFRVLDEQGREVGIGRQGELVVSGPNIMQGYWKDPQATAQVLDSNGYHTGDIGYRDEDGFFYVVGRKDGILKVGGHRVNPDEVEDALMESGLLVEAAVVGIPDPLLGTRLIALGVAKGEGCSGKEIIAFAANRLPRHKIPAAIQLLQKLPKNWSGKIDREACLRLTMENLGSG